MTRQCGTAWPAVRLYIPIALRACCTACRDSSCLPAAWACSALLRNAFTSVALSGLSIDPCWRSISSTAAMLRGHWLAHAGAAKEANRTETMSIVRIFFLPPRKWARGLCTPEDYANVFTVKHAQSLKNETRYGGK